MTCSSSQVPKPLEIKLPQLCYECIYFSNICLWMKIYSTRCLFFPALWFHNTLALQFGVGVNVFWRHLPLDSYDKKDPYGNKDPVAASMALQTLERALGVLDQLPAGYRDFYARRMVLRIQSRAYTEET